MISEMKSPGFRLASFAHCIVWICLVAIISKHVFLPILDSTSESAVLLMNGVARAPDFGAFFNFAKSFWLDQLPLDISVYSVENHLRVSNAWLGVKTAKSLSFGYSPTMLWLLAPLVKFSTAKAFCIFSAAGLLAVWWQTRPDRCCFGIGLLAFMSPVAMLCYLNGQTALLSGAGLLFLSDSSHKNFDRIASLQTVLCGLVLWALTAKPPLALTAGVVLLSLRQWRPVFLALFLFLSTTFALNSSLGPGWLTDYLHIIATHNRVQADPAFASSHVPELMANLRGVLSVDFNLQDNFASKISSIIWMMALTGIAAAGPRLGMTVGGFWSIGLLLYLLFCSHVSSSEVLQLVLLLPFCFPKGIDSLEWKSWALLLAIPVLPFISPVTFNNRILLFSGLLYLLGIVMCVSRKKLSVDTTMKPCSPQRTC